LASVSLSPTSTLLLRVIMTESLPNHLDNGTTITNKPEGGTGDQQDEPSQLVQDQMHDEELEEDEEQDEEIYGQSTLLFRVEQRGRHVTHSSLSPLLTRFHSDSKGVYLNKLEKYTALERERADTTPNYRIIFISLDRNRYLDLDQLVLFFTRTRILLRRRRRFHRRRFQLDGFGRSSPFLQGSNGNGTRRRTRYIYLSLTLSINIER